MRVLRIRAIIKAEEQPEGMPGLLWIHSDKDGNEVMTLWEDGEWKPIAGNGNALYFGEEEPTSKDVLWISNLNLEEYNNDNTVVKNLYARMAQIEKSLEPVLKLVNYGVVAGNSENSGRAIIMNSAEPIDPNPNPEPSDNEGAEEPETAGYEVTVPGISIKMDTSERFIKNYQNLIDGELLWVTNQNKLFAYIGGNFISIGGTGSGGGSVTIDEIMAFFFSHLGFAAENGTNFRLTVTNDGNLRVYYYAKRDNVGSIDNTWTNSGVYIAPRLNINSFYCGGVENDGHSYQSCSHNFVEIANGGTEDVNLDGLYLLYAPDKDTAWTGIPLSGKIEAGHTYLIRGAECSIKTNTTIINVDDYDLEWRDSKGNLMRFAQQAPIFYLVCSENGEFYNENDTLVPMTELTRAVYRTDTPIKGYIDLVGVGASSTAEGSSPISVTTGDEFKDTIFVRYYTLDPVSQANKAYASRKTNSLWTYINLQKEADEDRANPLYYYSKSSKIKYTPKASKDKKTIFSTKSTFREDAPNMLNITFGIQATDSGSGATRCFNWVSVGYYDEFLEYKAHDDTTWTKVHSIHEGGSYDEAISTFIDYYKRLRWETTNGTAVTSHKVVLKNLPAGTYDYRVGREGDSSYISEELQFVVKSSSSVTSFEFIQTSDQQGFNWLEYQAWKKAALKISEAHPNIDFTINTGDITQNGNRESEWLDYYDGRESLRGKEEMFTIGNNDLCGVQEYLLGDGTAGKYKINHNNVFHYFTFELDVNNPPVFTIQGEGEQPVSFIMPSVYSFNYGAYHFISLNSEWAANTYKVYTNNEGTAKQDVYKQLKDWFEADLALLGTTDYSKCIVFCHEMPYTIVTHATMTSNRDKGRGGSKLNDVFTNGQTYSFSRLFKQYGIRLVIGGHKHTYSISKPIYDAPEGYINEETHSPSQGADLNDPISAEASMQPVIQVTEDSEMIDPTFTFSGVTYKNGRYEKVTKINAPTYVMCQATGYKLVSNQEIPCREEDNPVWLRSYFGGIAKNNTADNANAGQYYPTYIHYVLSGTQIKVYSYQVTNIFIGHNLETNKAGSFNINNQSSNALGIQEILGGNGYTITL